MDKLIVIIIGLGIIGLVLWWFFAKRQTQAVQAEDHGTNQTALITVQGGYSPQTIVLKKGVPATLTFLRTDRSACFDEVVLPDFGKKADLPVDTPYDISITPGAAGKFQYSCGMHMFFGDIIVR